MKTIKEMIERNYIDYKLYSVIKLKNKYGFRVLLMFDDETKELIQYGGFDKKSDAIKENASEVLDNVLNHYTNNIEKLIYMAKIFTKNSAESSINISIVNGDNIEYLVSLKNNELVSYYSGRFKNNEKISEISFNEDGGYNFRVYDKENALKIVKGETNVISNLNNMRVLPITEYEKSIVEIYHIVFNEYPDVSKKEDRQRCKYLLCNLYVLGMFNYFDVDFNCFNGKIVSFSLNNEFDRLCGYGKIDFTSIKFKPDYLEKLNCLSTSLNLPLEQLKMLAISSYNGKYVQDYEESYSR